MEGETIGDGGYRILRRLGKGGDGTVYLVYHMPTEQLRAAKLMRSDNRERKFRELNMMKRLHHPSLPGILDVLEEDGSLWLIMEFIRGRPLSELDPGTITPEQFYSIARQLAEALVYLHSRPVPILHLDVKPSNVLVKPDGRVVLIDFGAAVFCGGGVREAAGVETAVFWSGGIRKPARSETAAFCGGTGEVARSGAAAFCGRGIGKPERSEAPALCDGGIRGAARFGTPGFAAPEQMALDGVLDGRTDIYGFGAAMYYCLYGRIFQGKETRKEEEDKLWRENCKRKSSPLGRKLWQKNADALLRRCLQRQKEKRFADSKALYESICRMEKKYLAQRRLRRSAGAAAVLFLSLVFSAGSLAWSRPAEETGLREEKYGNLLEMAEGLGLGQAAACYKEAALLYPEDGVWCLHLLKRIEEDLAFSLEEERSLKEVIFMMVSDTGQTAMEILESRSSEYGEIAYRLGMLYWYYYEGNGGKRAAARWFEQAVEFGENRKGSEKGSGGGNEAGAETEIKPETDAKAGIGTGSEVENNDYAGHTAAHVEESQPEWLESARIHSSISRYYEKLGKQDEEGRQLADYSVYWEDLCSLWELEGLREETLAVRGQLADELLSCLIMRTYELKKAGKTKSEVEEILRELEAFVRYEEDGLLRAEEAGETGNCEEEERKAGETSGIGDGEADQMNEEEARKVEETSGIGDGETVQVNEEESGEIGNYEEEVRKAEEPSGIGDSEADQVEEREQRNMQRTRMERYQAAAAAVDRVY